MIFGSKTNAYGDKTVKGYLCYLCYKKRIERRSWILFIFAIGFLVVSLILFSIAIWTILFARGFTRTDVEALLNIYLLWGGVMAFLGLILLFIRRKELQKVKILLKRQQSF